MRKENDPQSLEELVEQNRRLIHNPTEISESRQKFYYHTKRSTAQKILKGDPQEGVKPHFRISSLVEMNDEQECVWHEKEKNRVYALCFSYTDSESIPMWYLYSGISGEGIRIGITSLKMQELIQKVSVVYPIFHDRIDNSHPLYRDEDFFIEYGWVYYLGHKKICYKNLTYERQLVDDDEAIEKFKEENYFVKDYEWNYEREFRVVFRLNDRVFLEYPKQIALFFDKDDMMKRGGGISAMMAPEFKDVECEVLSEELGLPTRKIAKSKLKIKMNLIGRNRNSIIEHFDRIVGGVEKQTQLTEIEEIIQKRRKVIKEEQAVGIH